MIPVYLIVAGSVGLIVIFLMIMKYLIECTSSGETLKKTVFVMYGLIVLLTLFQSCWFIAGEIIEQIILDFHGSFLIFPPGGYERILHFYWLKKLPPLPVIG